MDNLLLGNRDVFASALGEGPNGMTLRVKPQIESFCREARDGSHARVTALYMPGRAAEREGKREGAAC